MYKIEEYIKSYHIDENIFNYDYTDENNYLIRIENIDKIINPTSIYDNDHYHITLTNKCTIDIYSEGKISSIIPDKYFNTLKIVYKYFYNDENITARDLFNIIMDKSNFDHTNSRLQLEDYVYSSGMPTKNINSIVKINNDNDELLYFDEVCRTNSNLDNMIYQLFLSNGNAISFSEYPSVKDYEIDDKIIRFNLIPKSNHRNMKVTYKSGKVEFFSANYIDKLIHRKYVIATCAVSTIGLSRNDRYYDMATLSSCIDTVNKDDYNKLKQELEDLKTQVNRDKSKETLFNEKGEIIW